MAKDLMKCDYNEVRFLSKKPFIINQELRDRSNEHCIQRNDEPKTEPI